MEIRFEPEQEAAILEVAVREGVTPGDVVRGAVRRFFKSKSMLIPRDDWERGFLDIATDCGVSPSVNDLSREDMHD